MVGDRLREVRQAKRLGLLAVEALTSGEFKASILGAYERGERAISVRRLIRLAQVYGVSPGILIDDKVRADLEELEALRRVMTTIRESGLAREEQ